MENSTKVIKRRKKRPENALPTFTSLTDSEKFQIIEMYRSGSTSYEIARAIKVDSKTIHNSLSVLIKDLNLVQETNKTLTYKQLKLPAVKTSKDITDDFIEQLKDTWPIFAYAFASTRDSIYALRSAGLDEVPPATSLSTKAYIYRIRSRYLQSIPEVQAEIKKLSKEIMIEENVDDNYVVREILGQLEEEKILRADNPASRKNSIALIKMLGEAKGTFVHKIQLDATVDNKTALDTLIEMAEVEVATGEYLVIDNGC